MFRRQILILLGCLALTLMAVSARADPSFDFLPSPQDPAGFSSVFKGCINQFKAAGGFAGSILSQLNGARIVVYYNKGDAFTDNPNPGGDSTGKPVYLYWDSDISGTYEGDKAPKLPCATLLHELQHANRFFIGDECTGPLYDNQPAYEYDEQMGSRAENWWLKRAGKPQRAIYKLGSKTLDLEPWTQWPRPAGVSIPPAPECIRCPDPDASLVSAADSSAGPASAICRRCIRFQQPGCVDFAGGVYSGGDHRRVAIGSLRIIVGDRGYCQGRSPCAFKDQYVAPHLDTAFPEGVTVTAIATPGKDSRFARWGPGACKGKGQTCTFIARKESCISAQFLLIKPTAPPQSLPTVACPEDP